MSDSSSVNYQSSVCLADISTGLFLKLRNQRTGRTGRCHLLLPSICSYSVNSTRWRHRAPRLILVAQSILSLFAQTRGLRSRIIWIAKRCNYNLFVYIHTRKWEEKRASCSPCTAAAQINLVVVARRRPSRKAIFIWYFQDSFPSLTVLSLKELHVATLHRDEPVWSSLSGITILFFSLSPFPWKISLYSFSFSVFLQDLNSLHCL